MFLFIHFLLTNVWNKDAEIQIKFPQRCVRTNSLMAICTLHFALVSRGSVIRLHSSLWFEDARGDGRDQFFDFPDLMRSDGEKVDHAEINALANY